MVKDRPIELKQQHNKGKNKSSVIEIDGNTQADSVRSENKSKTFELAKVLGQWIQQIEQNNKDLRLYFSRIEDVNKQKDTEEKIKEIFQRNTNIAQKIIEKLKELDNKAKSMNSDTTEGRIKNTQYSTLKTRFNNAFWDNKQLLEYYRNALKKIITTQLQSKGYLNATDEEVTSLLEDGADIHVFTKNISAETAEAKQLLASVEERHQQLLQIERMVTEVRDLVLQIAESQQELFMKTQFQVQKAPYYHDGVRFNPVRRDSKRTIYIILIISLICIKTIVFILIKFLIK